MGETREARLKRMTMRAWRRGTKEMDLILGPWADVHLAGLTPTRLEDFERLLAENDTDLLPWMLGKGTPPAAFSALISEIGAYARARLQPKA